MLITSSSVEGRNYQLFDELGRLIPYAKSFDTETGEVELYVLLNKKEDGTPYFLTEATVPSFPGNLPGRELVTIKVIVPGACLKLRDTPIVNHFGN